jgi:hypothetical protein
MSIGATYKTMSNGFLGVPFWFLESSSLVYCVTCTQVCGSSRLVLSVVFATVVWKLLHAYLEQQYTRVNSVTFMVPNLVGSD